MTTLSELLVEHPDLPVEVYCSHRVRPYGQRCGVRLGRWPVLEFHGDYVELGFDKGVRLASDAHSLLIMGVIGERMDLVPRPTDRMEELFRYDWLCPKGHDLQRRQDRLGRVEATLGKDAIQAYV